MTWTLSPVLSWGSQENLRPYVQQLWRHAAQSGDQCLDTLDHVCPVKEKHSTWSAHQHICCMQHDVANIADNKETTCMVRVTGVAAGVLSLTLAAFTWIRAYRWQ